MNMRFGLFSVGCDWLLLAETGHVCRPLLMHPLQPLRHSALGERRTAPEPLPRIRAGLHGANE